MRSLRVPRGHGLAGAPEGTKMTLTNALLIGRIDIDELPTGCANPRRIYDAELAGPRGRGGSKSLVRHTHLRPTKAFFGTKFGP